jgi:farnesyl-diphosphate farnesyltransferase
LVKVCIIERESVMDTQNNKRQQILETPSLPFSEFYQSSYRQGALDILEATSRTFFIPISRLPSGLLEAVASAYLCMRAIDEVEDHPTLNPDTKVKLLQEISHSLQAAGNGSRWVNLDKELRSYEAEIPEVTLRLSEWVQLAPETIAPRIWDTTGAMADRMAGWVESEWVIRTKADLDRYTFCVASAVGLMLSDLWSWYDGTKTDRLKAVGFGRGLQSVNILRNRNEDLSRGVDFYPVGWENIDMFNYARDNLALADEYLEELPPGPAFDFCVIPLKLAHATLNALAQGREKITREEVKELVG